MPVHDWERIHPGVFHAFHNTWLGEIQTSLNDGLLPSDHYALCDQQAGDTIPDVLTLQEITSNGDGAKEFDNGDGGVGVATLTKTMPRVRQIQHVEADLYAARRKSIVIRHSSDDRIVAMIEIVSPGNKSSTVEFRRFVDKAVAALNHGIHLLVVDLFPPGTRDPHGMHGAIWSEFGAAYDPPSDKLLTLVAYSAGMRNTAFVEPIAVGDTMIDMPIFLEPDGWVPTPLQATYDRAYRGVPRRFREMLERPGTIAKGGTKP